jgi:aldose 1-epimerase
VGASLVLLQFKGNDLVEERKHARYFSGEILAPWPNRIADGKYKYRGQEFKVPVNEAQRNNALHGLVFDKIWNLEDISESSLVFQILINQSVMYPGTIKLKIEYQLSELGLRSTLTANNISDTPVPYGASTHPYLQVANLSSVDDYVLSMNSSQVLLTDEVRLLPKELINVETVDLDFRKSQKIGPRFIDHAFRQDSNEPREVTVTDKNGNGVIMIFSEEAKWIQIHTTDREGGLDSRKVLAVEPMTCPPDAFNSGVDLIDLEPEGSHTLWWEIAHLVSIN